MDTNYTTDDLLALAPEWERVFGESMPFGFVIGPSDVPLMRQCIRERSMKPLDDHIKSLLADGRVY